MWYPNDSVIPHYLGEGTRPRQLGKAGEGTEIPKWHTLYEADPEHGRDEVHRSLACGWVPPDPQRLQRTNWMLNWMAKWAAISSSNVMKCNTQSSTESELISIIHNKLPDIIWTSYFVEGQGYAINEYMIFQDNMSSLPLEKSGRVSSLKRPKHIKAKYFLIKDY